jgi:hypothetical protein
VVGPTERPGLQALGGAPDARAHASESVVGADSAARIGIS